MGNSGNAALAYTYLIGKGLTPAQSAGVVGNLMQESGVSPSAVGDNGTSFGIAQWHAGRWTALQNWAAANHLNANSLTTQLGYLWQELNTGEIGSLQALKTTSSPASAAISFQNNYERCSECNQSARVANAQAVFNGTATSGSSAGSAAGAFPGGTSSGATDATLTSANSNPDNQCVIPIKEGGILGAGAINWCLWYPSWSRAAIGGAMLAAGGIAVIFGIAIIAKSTAVGGVASGTIAAAPKNVVPTNIKSIQRDIAGPTKTASNTRIGKHFKNGVE
jgi:hypothetical protein